MSTNQQKKKKINTTEVKEKSNQTSDNTAKQQIKAKQTEKETQTTTKTKTDNTNSNTKNNQKQESSKNNAYIEKEVQVVEINECVGNKHKMFCWV